MQRNINIFNLINSKIQSQQKNLFLCKMISVFTTHIKANFPFLLKDNILIAISGGVDSVVLTHLLYKLGANIGLAHVNFQLRGEESNQDAFFVKSLAEQMKIAVFFKTIDTNSYAKQHKQSTQMAARETRYQWFEELLAKENYNYILTAHHADDAIETFFINLSRSSGLEGLTGIPSQNNNVVRPLLPFSRADIEEYALANKLIWREDASNATTKYLRNKIRHELVPVLKAIFPNFQTTFSQTQTHLKESQALVKDYISKIKPKIWEERNDKRYLSLEVLQEMPNTKAVLYELLKEYGFTEWNVICKLLDAQTGKQVFSKDYFLLKDRSFLVLGVIKETNYKPQQVGVGDVFVVEGTNSTPKNYKISALSQSEINMEKYGDLNEAYIDKSKIKLPFTVRNWKKGDYFYPLGMQGKKKISNFLIDQKTALFEKEKIQLLCDANNTVVWVIGKRLDNRFKITEKTTDIIKIHTI